MGMDARYLAGVGYSRDFYSGGIRGFASYRCTVALGKRYAYCVFTSRYCIERNSCGGLLPNGREAVLALGEVVGITGAQYAVGSVFGIKYSRVPKLPYARPPLAQTNRVEIPAGGMNACWGRFSV